MSKFYSYLYIREDGTPYYVGKGKGRRVFNIKGHHIHPPKDRSRILIFPQDSEAEAFESEREMIWLFGRKDLGKGCLRNMTDGGEGFANPTEETRNKLRLATSEMNHKRRLLWLGKWGHNTNPANRRPKHRISEIAEKQRKIWEDRFIKTVAWG